MYLILNFVKYLPDVVDIDVNVDVVGCDVVEVDPVNGSGVVVGCSKIYLLWESNKAFRTLILILKLNCATVYDMVFFLHNLLL